METLNAFQLRRATHGGRKVSFMHDGQQVVGILDKPIIPNTPGYDRAFLTLDNGNVYTVSKTTLVEVY